MNKSKELKEHADRLKSADLAYYRDNNSSMTDGEYDRLKQNYKKLVSLVGEDPYDLNKIGNDIQGVWPINTHRHPMLSLDNVFSEDSLIEWMVSIERQIGYRGPYAIEMKYDGVSIEVASDGDRDIIVTRGDGYQGEDITPRALPIIGGNIIARPPDVEAMYGEVLMTKDALEKLNRVRVESGKTPYSNPRNGISGLIRSKSSPIPDLDSGDILFMPYSAYHAGRLVLNQELEIGTVKLDEADGIIDRVCKYRNLDRDKIPFEIDGLVFKVKDESVIEELGNTNHHPRWAIAYKFPEQISTTKLISIHHQVGRTGVITPAALVEPTNIGGVTVTAATLHNFDDIERLGNPQPGDLLKIKRAGDVIPKIVGIQKRGRDNTNKPISIPSHCPSCGSHLEKDGAYLRCKATFDCPDQARQRLLHQCSRRLLNIKGLGEVATRVFTRTWDIEHGCLPMLSDLIGMNDEVRQLYLKLPDKNYVKIKSHITPPLYIPVWMGMALLCIPGVGVTSSKILSMAGYQLKDFNDPDSKMLKRLLNDPIQGLGEETINKIEMYMNDPRAKLEVDRLVNYFVHPNEDKLGMEPISITGSINISRSVLEKRLPMYGYYLTDLSKKTRYLIVGESYSEAKINKSSKYGIPVIYATSFTDITQHLVPDTKDVAWHYR